MGKWQLSGSALIAAAVIGAIAFVLGPHASWAPTIVSGIVLLILFTFDRGPLRTGAESVAYAAVCGFLVVSALAYPLYVFLPEMTASPAEVFSSKPWLPIAWVIVTLVVLGVDRMRANTRPVTVALATPQQPVFTPPAPVVIAPQPEPPSPAPVVSEPQPVPVAAAVPAAPAPAVPQSVPAMPRPTPAPLPVAGKVVQPVAVPKGKPATIYLNLVGSGISCLRAVKAEHLGQDFFKIVEEIPSGEAWEFQPGQIVRCRKRTLSSGKAMVAYEEAPRAS